LPGTAFLFQWRAVTRKDNNNEKGFIQVKETIQASHQQWHIKKNNDFLSFWWIILVHQTESPVKKCTISYSLINHKFLK
jgi:hypothetical protein